MAGNHIHKAPWAVTKHGVALVTQCFQLADMPGKIVDAVGIMYTAVLTQLLAVGYAVFRHDHRQAVAVIDLPHSDGKTCGVNTLVHPLCLFQMGIVTKIKGIGNPERGLVVVDGAFLCFDANAEIIVDSQKIRGSCLQHLFVLRHRHRVQVMGFQIMRNIRWILTKDAHVEAK